MTTNVLNPEYVKLLSEKRRLEEYLRKLNSVQDTCQKHVISRGVATEKLKDLKPELVEKSIAEYIAFRNSRVDNIPVGRTVEIEKKHRISRKLSSYVKTNVKRYLANLNSPLCLIGKNKSALMAGRLESIPYGFRDAFRWDIKIRMYKYICVLDKSRGLFEKAKSGYTMDALLASQGFIWRGEMGAFRASCAAREVFRLYLECLSWGVPMEYVDLSRLFWILETPRMPQYFDYPVPDWLEEGDAELYHEFVVNSLSCPYNEWPKRIDGSPFCVLKIRNIDIDMEEERPRSADIFTQLMRLELFRHKLDGCRYSGPTGGRNIYGSGLYDKLAIWLRLTVCKNGVNIGGDGQESAKN